MFDPAILLALEASMPPQPPVMAEERVLYSDAGAAAARVGEKLTKQYDSLASKWLVELDAIKSRFDAVEIKEAATQDDIRHLDALIEEYETHADLRARKSVRLAKRIRRDVKAYFQHDASLGAVGRQVGAKLVGTDKRIVEALLDYALFLRAIRSDCDATSKGARVFDTPDDLASYLNGLIAA